MFVLRFLLDAIAPLRCAGCGCTGTDFCPTCCSKISQAPAALRRDVDGVCIVFALGAYEGPLRRAILALKYQNRRDVGETLGAMIGAKAPLSGDLLVPVPLHPARLAKRGYNQAELLARALASRWLHECGRDIPVIDALRRVRATVAQSDLRLGAREENVRAAFGPGTYTKQALGKHAVLIDDVVTTGATLHQCAVELRSCGVARVSAIAAAARL